MYPGYVVEYWKAHNREDAQVDWVDSADIARERTTEKLAQGFYVKIIGLACIYQCAPGKKDVATVYRLDDDSRKRIIQVIESQEELR